METDASEVREDLGYSSERPTHYPSTRVRTSPPSAMRRERPISNGSEPLPEGLSRIRLLRGMHSGRVYVYATSIAEDLVRQGKAVYESNQAEM